MREEEKKAVEHLNSFLNIPEFVWIKESELLMINVKIVLNLIENQQKELNNLKEIEKSHKKENGKLRVELEQEKEKNKELYEQNQIYLSNGSNVKLELHIKNNYISKDKLKFILSKLNISDIEPWSIYKIDGQILFDLEELL